MVSRIRPDKSILLGLLIAVTIVWQSVRGHTDEPEGGRASDSPTVRSIPQVRPTQWTVPFPPTPIEPVPAAVATPPIEAATGEETEGVEFPEVEAIGRLRRAMGDPLAGTALGGSTSAEFAQALSGIAARGGATGPRPVVDRRNPSAAQTPLASDVGTIPARAGDSIGPEPARILSDQDVVTLRAAARQLERSAAALEDLGRYDDADQLREMVARLRRSARDVDLSVSHAARNALRQALRGAN